jgi:hypothetical protein
MVEAKAAEPCRVLPFEVDLAVAKSSFRQKVSKKEQIGPIRQCYAAVSVWAAFDTTEAAVPEWATTRLAATPKCC